MIIRIEAHSRNYEKRMHDFCNQISCRDLAVIEDLENKKSTSTRLAKVKHIRDTLEPMMRRPNQDVSDKHKNELREAIQESWTSYRETWSIPETERIKISFPDTITDAWQQGRAYYIFTSTPFENRVVRF